MKKVGTIITKPVTPSTSSLPSPRLTDQGRASLRRAQETREETWRRARSYFIGYTLLSRRVMRAKQLGLIMQKLPSKTKTFQHG